MPSSFLPGWFTVSLRKTAQDKVKIRLFVTKRAAIKTQDPRTPAPKAQTNKKIAKSKRKKALLRHFQ